MKTIHIEAWQFTELQHKQVLYVMHFIENINSMDFSF